MSGDNKAATGLIAPNNSFLDIHHYRLNGLL